MKRMFSFFLALALLAVLSGCGKQEPTPSKPDEPTPPPEEGITLTELNVEFVAGDRDTDALMQLKKELPPLAHRRARRRGRDGRQGQCDLRRK